MEDARAITAQTHKLQSSEAMSSLVDIEVTSQAAVMCRAASRRALTTRTRTHKQREESPRGEPEHANRDLHGPSYVLNDQQPQRCNVVTEAEPRTSTFVILRESSEH